MASCSIPRHQVYLNLSEAEKAGAIDTFYTVVKEELDIVPAQVRVLEYLFEQVWDGVGAAATYHHQSGQGTNCATPLA